jgi:beta-alanine degradation protein BauB
MRRLLIPLVLLIAITSAQTNSEPSKVLAAIEVVPVDKEPAHKLVFENEYVRVFSVEVAPHSETKYHQHDRDYVGVILGDADVESVRLGEAAVQLQLKDGEARFTKGGFAHKAVNKGDKPFRNVTVEFKKPVGKVTPESEYYSYGEAGHCLPGKTSCGAGSRSRATVFDSEGWSVLSITASSVWGADLSKGVLVVPLTDIVLVAPKETQRLASGEPVWTKVPQRVNASEGQYGHWIVISPKRKAKVTAN